MNGWKSAGKPVTNIFQQGFRDQQDPVTVPSGSTVHFCTVNSLAGTDSLDTKTSLPGLFLGHRGLKTEITLSGYQGFTSTVSAPQTDVQTALEPWSRKRAGFDMFFSISARQAFDFCFHSPPADGAQKGAIRASRPRGNLTLWRGPLMRKNGGQSKGPFSRHNPVSADSSVPWSVLPKAAPGYRQGFTGGTKSPCPIWIISVWLMVSPASSRGTTRS